MSLKILQQQFQSYLLNNNDTILSDIVFDHMSIYQNGYYERIISALKQDFPVLCAHLGEGAFSGLVIDYIQHHPSNQYNLRDVGKNLSAFILSRDSNFAFYADMAKLEWLLCCDDGEMIKLFESKYDILDIVNAYHKI